MSALSVRELNSNISKILARVEAGETLEITRNGKVIAELRPRDRRASDVWRKAYHDSVKALRQGFPVNAGTIGEDDKYGDAEL